MGSVTVGGKPVSVPGTIFARVFSRLRREFGGLPLLSDLTGIAVSRLSEMESGDVLPSTDEVRELANVLGVAEDYLSLMVERSQSERKKGG